MNKNNLTRIECSRQFRKQIRGSKRYLTAGIDVAKSEHRAFVGTANGGTVLRQLIVEDSASGFEHLLAQVQFYMIRDGLMGRLWN